MARPSARGPGFTLLAAQVAERERAQRELADAKLRAEHLLQAAQQAGLASGQEGERAAREREERQAQAAALAGELKRLRRDTQLATKFATETALARWAA